jgi:hypothetical protein
MANDPEVPHRYFEVLLRKKGKITEPLLPEGMQDYAVEYNKSKTRAMIRFFDADNAKMSVMQQNYIELNEAAYNGKINSADYRG